LAVVINYDSRFANSARSFKRINGSFNFVDKFHKSSKAGRSTTNNEQRTTKRVSELVVSHGEFSLLASYILIYGLVSRRRISRRNGTGIMVAKNRFAVSREAELYRTVSMSTGRDNSCKRLTVLKYRLA
jgi:hypothetical protein